MRITRFSALAIATGLLLLSSLLLVEVREYLINKKPPPDLERLISEHPVGWATLSSQSVNSEWSKSMRSDYDMVTTRTYQYPDGKTVSVVMTWSRDGIRRAGHLQQVCYLASGSTISTPKYATVSTKVGQQNVIAFTESHDNQIQDVIYWRLTGGEIDIDTGYLLSWRIHKLFSIALNMFNDMPDNLMIRVTSMRSSSDKPATAHIDYIREYLERLPANDRKLIMGK